MTKFGLLGSSALRSAFVVGATFAVAAPAFAQAAQPAAPPASSVQPVCDPNDPNRDPNTGNCVQPPEGAPGTTAPGSNPATTPSDEEPTQSELDPNAPDSETLVVTGSRIPRPQFEGTIPGAQVTAEQIQARAFTNTLEVLNDIPLVGPGASPFGTNGGQPASLGAAFVDLLDLGTNRTLTLVNGRRYVSGNAGTLFVAGNVTGSQVDLNTIPSGLIARLDVLTVGGAVAYGSDAIAGVVNVILRDDYEGAEFNALTSISEEGDNFGYRFRGLVGTNFLGDRGNVALSFEYTHDDQVLGNQRLAYLLNPVAPTFFRQGGVRNPGFVPSVPVGQGAFLPSSSDLVPNNAAGTGFFGGSILLSAGGSVFAATGGSVSQPFQGLATAAPTAANNFRPGVTVFQAGNVNLVPGAPTSAATAGCNVTNLTSFCAFAPSGLPAGSAAQQAAFTNAVIAQFAPAQAGQGTPAQRNALAVQLLQANRPTAREFLQANPNTDINAFIGTFATGSAGGFGARNFLTIPNTNPATSAALPFVAVPLQFDAAGNIIQITPAVITDPLATPATTGGAVGASSFFNPAFTTVLRAGQDRYIGNLIAHFDLTDNLTIYTENQYARVENIGVSTLSTNTIGASTTENAALVLNINNPFLDAGDRARLQQARVTNNFILSRVNNDIGEDLNRTLNTDTYRSLLGLKGDFGLFGRSHTFDASFTYGRSDLLNRAPQLGDIEFALAIDAVRDPATGNIVCRAQIDPAARTLPRGVAGTELVRVRNAEGVFVEQIVTRTVSDEQVAACRPFNPFGVRQFSAEAEDYVLTELEFRNKSEQLFGQLSFAGTLFDLPGGPLGYALVGEYRRDSLRYTPSEVARIGGSRFAAIAETSGFIENYEFGAEFRIPIFGEDFSFPLLRNLEITPGIRFVHQSGDAPDVQPLVGELQTNEAPGKWNEIYTLAGSYRPIRDITFRGNYTRSIRQPSIVELFLGGQPAFTTVGDPCSPANIGSGTRPATRRANCEAAVIAAGLASNQAGAATFLQNYVPSGATISGSFAGSPGLQPERGESYTVGLVFNPTFLPTFRFSADYINVKVRNQIIPTGIGTALQVCFDSPNFPDTTDEVGVNVCNFFNRIPAGAESREFEIANGFASGFINLGALQVKAINMNLLYDQRLEPLFGEGAGKFQISANAYHLLDYFNAPSGDLSDPQQTAGSFTRPTWELQLRGRYENEDFFAQWTWNYQNATRVLSAGAPITIENQDVLGFGAFGVHDATIGFNLGEEGQSRYGIQFTVRNVFDKRFEGGSAGAIALGSGGQIDAIGRRYTVTANLRF